GNHADATPMITKVRMTIATTPHDNSGTGLPSCS
ncbi:hypothetical protein D030_3342B, partial [Vibrio parahaemolyticus AQ3810]